MNVYRIKNTALHIVVMADRRLLNAIVDRPHDPTAHVVERLDVTTRDDRCHLAEWSRDVLVIDGPGLARLGEALGTIYPSEDGEQLYHRVRRYFSGSTTIGKMLRGAILAYCPWQTWGGAEDRHWRNVVNEQRAQHGEAVQAGQ